MPRGRSEKIQFGIHIGLQHGWTGKFGGLFGKKTTKSSRTSNASHRGNSQEKKRDESHDCGHPARPLSAPPTTLPVNPHTKKSPGTTLQPAFSDDHLGNQGTGTINIVERKPGLHRDLQPDIRRKAACIHPRAPQTPNIAHPGLQPQMQTTPPCANSWTHQIPEAEATARSEERTPLLHDDHSRQDIDIHSVDTPESAAPTDTIHPHDQNDDWSCADNQVQGKSSYDMTPWLKDATPGVGNIHSRHDRTRSRGNNVSWRDEETRDDITNAGEEVSSILGEPSFTRSKTSTNRDGSVSQDYRGLRDRVRNAIRRSNETRGGPSNTRGQASTRTEQVSSTRVEPSASRVRPTNTAHEQSRSWGQNPRNTGRSSSPQELAANRSVPPSVVDPPGINELEGTPGTTRRSPTAHVPPNVTSPSDDTWDGRH